MNGRKKAGGATNVVMVKRTSALSTSSLALASECPLRSGSTPANQGATSDMLRQTSCARLRRSTSDSQPLDLRYSTLYGPPILHEPRLVCANCVGARILEGAVEEVLRDISCRVLGGCTSSLVRHHHPRTATGGRCAVVFCQMMPARARERILVSSCGSRGAPSETWTFSMLDAWKPTFDAAHPSEC